jgi:Predicted transcriptional regulators
MNIEIANRLAQLRKDQNLSQEELAAKIGVSRQAISNWERGEASPDTDNLILLANIYGKTIDEILTGNPPKVEATPETITSQENTSEQYATSFQSNPEPTSHANSYRFWATFPYPIICVIIFLILGFSFDVWHPAWLIFLTIPIYYWFFPHHKDRHDR